MQMADSFNGHLEIHLISGGTCRTALQVTRACLAQFSAADVQINQHPNVRSLPAVDAILQQSSGKRSILCHSLVDPEVRHALNESALKKNIPCVDVLGPTLSVLGDSLAQTAKGLPGLLYELHREQFDRMDAVDFTMAHDDGNRLLDLGLAEAVVTGVSRVSKSVTCFYLASRGVRSANVPLIPDQIPPEELIAMPADRVFGLTMNASRLASIRQARINRISKGDVPHYANVRELNRELHFAENLMEIHRWHRIDVSYMATEEVASHILDLLPPRES